MSNTKQWEVNFEFDIMHRQGSCSYPTLVACSSEEQRIKMFISELLEEKEKEFEKRLEAIYKQGKFDAEIENTPMGVSQWRSIGKKFGYWKYFEEEIRVRVEKMRKTGVTAIARISGTYELYNYNQAIEDVLKILE